MRGSKRSSETMRTFGDAALHLMSLLSALTAQCLQQQGDLQALRKRRIKKSSERESRGGRAAVGWRLPQTFARYSMWDEFKDYFEVEPICAVDMPVLGGVSHAERELLSRHSLHQRVNIVYEWLVRTLTLRIREGGLAARSPTAVPDLSEAMEGYCDATLVSEVPFALPFMQMQVVLELVTLVLLPLVIALFTESQLAAFTFTFMTTLSLYALNEVIVELEVPFAPHQDEVPLQEFHRRWNEILLSTLRPAFLNSDYTMDAHRAHDLRHADEEEPTSTGMPKLQLGGRATLQSSEGPPAAAFTDVPAERDAAAKLRAVEEADPKVGHPLAQFCGVRVGRRREGAAGTPARGGARRGARPAHPRPALHGERDVGGGTVTVQPAARRLGAPLEEAPGVSVGAAAR